MSRLPDWELTNRAFKVPLMEQLIRNILIVFYVEHVRTCRVVIFYVLKRYISGR